MNKNMTVYWILDKINGNPAVCSSIKAVAKATLMKYSTLSYQFSVKKRDHYETDRFRIEKTRLIRSTMKKGKEKPVTEIKKKPGGWKDNFKAPE